MKSVGRELRAVKRRSREASKSKRQGLRSDRARFAERFSAELLGQKRSASDRRGASAAEEARFGDAIPFHANRKLKNVAADRVADFHGGVGRRKFAGVARVAEMIEDGVAEHLRKYGNPARNLQRQAEGDGGQGARQKMRSASA
jgi:hypothetical protein